MATMLTSKADETRVNNVVIPFADVIPNELQPGDEIEINGKIPYGAVQFAINLAYGHNEESKLADIAFHLNIRFNHRCVVRNARVNGQWVCEQREGIFLFRTGCEFKILIFAERKSFKVAVNGQHFCEYVHRIPLTSVKMLTIEDDVEVKEIIYRHKPYPDVPYTGAIPNGIQPGKMIEIIGETYYSSNRFTVNLACGDEARNSSTDIPFHLSCRFDQNCVVRNNFVGGDWGPEEREGGNPFQKGNEYRILILTDPQSYKVAINGAHFCEFAHRLPFTSVQLLQVEGDCDVKRIIYHSPNLGQKPLSPPSGFLEPLYNPVIPFSHLLQQGLYPGLMIYISGRPNVNPYRFIINLQCGEAPYPDPDVAFHKSVRFDQTSVVRNSKISGSYGKEEVHIPHFPFQPGVYFDMIIRVEPQMFMVAINGQHFIEYEHRIMPVNRVNVLHIEGDVVITSVRFQ